MLPPETPGLLQGSPTQSLVGTLLLSPGSWCTQSFVCALQESVSQSCVSSVIKSHWPPKSNSLGFSVPLPDPQVEKSIVGPRTFLTMQEFLWYNCSAVCGLSSHWLYSPWGCKESDTTEPFSLSLSNNREETQSCPSTENWIKDLQNMDPPIRTRPSFPLSHSLLSGSFHKPLILLHQRADRLKTMITENEPM